MLELAFQITRGTFVTEPGIVRGVLQKDKCGAASRNPE